MNVFLDDIRRWCPDNNRLSSCLLSFFENNGFRLVSDYRDSDVMVVNACNITRRQVGLIERGADAFRRRGAGKIVVIGCPPWFDKAEQGVEVHVLPNWKLRKDPAVVDRTFGAAKPFRWLTMDEALLRDGLSLPGFPAELSDACFIKVSSGCLSHCSFCAAPQAQGAFKSEPLERIVEDAREGLKRGRRWLVLWSKDNGCWGHDLGLALPDLLERLVALDPGVKLAVPYLNPTYLEGMRERLLPLLGNVPYMTAPMQSGSQRIVELMGRDYDVPRVLGIVDRIRAAGTKVVTSMIVGHPTETRADFAETVRAALRFDLVTITRLYVHPGTKVASMKLDVPEDEVEARLRALERSCARAGVPTMFYDDVNAL